MSVHNRRPSVMWPAAVVLAAGPITLLARSRSAAEALLTVSFLGLGAGLGWWLVTGPDKRRAQRAAPHEHYRGTAPLSLQDVREIPQLRALFKGAHTWPVRIVGGLAMGTLTVTDEAITWEPASISRRLGIPVVELPLVGISRLRTFDTLGPRGQCLLGILFVDGGVLMFQVARRDTLRNVLAKTGKLEDPSR